MSRERERQNKRLLNVARACRESPHPQKFTMKQFGYDCGTPACALGHYAYRSDLQRTFEVGRYGSLFVNHSAVGYDNIEVLKHFGIDETESHLLFSEFGCLEAQTPNEAADFIETFVENRK